MDDSAFAPLLLEWYGTSRRLLPWRAEPGGLADPYRVWLSEVMLQQTQVQAVIPYFLEFTRRWPSIGDLAAAPAEEVMAAWAGLGYYARARNLLACARLVAGWRGGRFPEDEEGLRQLPGLGAYSAAAIAAMAFGKPAVVVDGNVERVMARLFAITTPLPKAKAELRALAARLTPSRHAGDYAQAVMDLGATICTPRSPACGICPWRPGCLGLAQGVAGGLPARAEKPPRPTRQGIAFWITRPDGAVLLRRRPPKGLLGGMLEIPSTPWREEEWQPAQAWAEAPLALDGWRMLPGSVGHTFTHFHLELRLATARAPAQMAVRGVWCPLDQLEQQGLPTLMRKLARHALARAYRGTDS